MAKKRIQRDESEQERQSRKEILRSRKESEQTKQIRLAVAGVGALIALVLIFAIVNELIIAPNQPVATVNGEEISMREWQDRVRYERAQRIISLENQYEAFGGDVGIIQQFSLQTLQELLDNEALAEAVLDQMADELLIRQEAESRGITVGDSDVEEEIGTFFNYFGGELPTPLPTATETVIPTPSLTPIPTAVITDVLPTNTPFPTPTLGPTNTPQPTATPVTKESFDEQLGELVADFRTYDVDEDTFREVVLMQIYLERLADALAEEQDLATEAPHASIFLLSFDTEEDANEALAMIQDSDYLTVWNTIRSTPVDAETAAIGNASELLWRTQDVFAASFGDQVAEDAFLLPLNVPSPLITQQVDAETTRYHIIQVSGRAVRPLTESAIQTAKTELVRNLLAEKAVTAVEISERWRSRVPTQPILDPKFLAQPTATPLVPGLDTGTDSIIPNEGQ